LTPKVKIVTDSTAYLRAETIARYDIRVVPLKVAFGAEVYSEGVDTTNEEFYRRLAKSSTLPTTSQPPVNDFIQVYSELASLGHPILSIHISGKLSGTINSALAARNALPQAQIEIVDSQSIAMGLLISHAAEAAEEGQTLSQIKALTEKLITRMNVVAVIDTLKYLWKGGRIGGAMALVGTVLKIKPVLTFEDGEVKVLAKARTVERATEYLLDFMKKRTRGNNSIHAAVVHTHAFDKALALEKEVLAGFECVEFYLIELGPVLGTHIGPGTLGLAFYTDEQSTY